MAVTPPLPCKRDASLECEWPGCKCYPTTDAGALVAQLRSIALAMRGGGPYLLQADLLEEAATAIEQAHTMLAGSRRIIDELKGENAELEKDAALLRFVRRDNPITVRMWRNLFDAALKENKT